MLLVPFSDVPFGFRLRKIPQECPFQGSVFFEQAKTEREKSGMVSERMMIYKMCFSCTEAQHTNQPAQPITFFHVKYHIL